MKALFIGGAVLAILAVSYLFTVALTWLVLVLVEAIWGVTTEVNVWLLGLLAWVVIGVLKSIFKSDKN